MTTIFLSTDADGNYHIKLQSDDPDSFRTAIDTLKNYVSPVYRKYDPRTKHWTVANVADSQFRHWLDYAQHTLGALVEWLNDDDSESEWTPPKSVRPKPVDPYQTLHLLPSAPPEVVKAAYRALAVLHHPDHGGDTAAMQRINDAFKKLVA